MANITPVALVTGAAHRLGAKTAEALHARGWNLIIHYRSNEELANALVASMNHSRTGSAVIAQADLSNLYEVRRLGETAASFWGRLDGLVNNASAFYPTPTGAVSEPDWDRLLTVNLKAPFFLLQACLPDLKKHKGCVINLIDIYSEKPLANHPVYCATKAGLAALTRSWAKDLAPAVRVNGVSPGAILWPEGSDNMNSAHKQSILERTPLERTGSPSDIAGAIAYLMCDASFVTGQILNVDGGRSLNM